MSEDRRLHDKLDKLRAVIQPGQTGPREIHGKDAGDMLRAILLEIDETILARAVTFGIQGGNQLCLEIANRRLLRVVDVPDAATGDLPASLRDQDVTEDDTTLLADLGGYLHAQLAEATGMTIQTAKLDRTTGAADIGCSAAGLAHAFSIDLYGDGAGEPTADLQDLLNECSELAGAWIYVDANGVQDQSETSPELEKLQELVANGVKPIQDVLDGILASPKGLRCVVSGSDGVPDMRIVLITDRGSFALLMVAAKNLATVVAQFRQHAG